MKKLFTDPEMELLRIDMRNIVMASGDEDLEEDQLPPVPIP